MNDPKPTKTDKQFGSWEKHTKGIGLKYLQKFGFTGRLGAKEDGVSRAVEVVVRPTGAGLGFGDTIEASSLKVNKRIEAEWRGLEVPEELQESDDDDVAKPKKRKRQSAIEQLAESKLWKIGKNEKDSIKSQQKLAADDFIQKYLKPVSDSAAAAAGATAAAAPVIIDMRYKDTRIITDMTELSADMEDIEEDLQTGQKQFTKTPKLGQELLYNLNMIGDLEEMQANRESKALANEVSRIKALHEDIEHLLQKKNKENRRYDRLQRIQEALQRINKKLLNDDNISSSDGITLSAACSVIKMLHENFEEEFSVFGLINMLPYILNQIIQIQHKERSDIWHPKDHYKDLEDIQLTLQPLLDYFYEADAPMLAIQARRAYQNLIESSFLTSIRRYVTTEWNVEMEVDVCVRLFTSLKAVLSEEQFEQTIQMLLLPKLSTAVAGWQPRAAVPSSLMIDTWLHPWLPLLRSQLSVLYPEIRRKMGKFLSHWQPSALTEERLNEVQDEAVRLLMPWKHVFDSASFENLMVRSVLPKIAYFISEHLTIPLVAIGQESFAMNIIRALLVWQSILPANHFNCLFAGEVMPKLVRALYDWLQRSSEKANADFEDDVYFDAEVLIGWYNYWRCMLPTSAFENSLIVKLFDFMLQLLMFSLESIEIDRNGEHRSGKLWFPARYRQYIEKTLKHIESFDYFSIIAQQKRQSFARVQLHELQVDEAKRAARRRYHASMNQEISYKDVVDSFAQEHSVEFAPVFGKQTDDGQQIWLFDGVPCYIHNNVLFASEQAPRQFSSVSSNGSNVNNVHWNPVQLEELLSIARSKKS